ncbi:hypothetical protein FHX52_2086 [Humibacillus xanthopallidus]|uniref:Uncharacterized protein n=1 Tax=Humibacillus xanthopallidus TaxID=412689 RepID=A0A543PY15_9MICO|nr:hypothetical protein FHX52_2086 [Humibacillus xanthopallidus]
MRAAHDDGVTGGVVVALGVAVVAVVVPALEGAAVEVVTVAEVVVAEGEPLARPSVVLPVEHAATSDVRRRATGRTARDGIRLGIARP